MSEQPAGQQGPPQPPAQPSPEINDPPIEHDPWGQALVSLPFAVGSALGSAAAEGASVAGSLAEEGIAWAASELGIGVGEHIAEHANDPAASPLMDDSPDATVPAADASVPGQGAPDGAGAQSTPEDGGVCEDPGYTPYDMPAE